MVARWKMQSCSMENNNVLILQCVLNLIIKPLVFAWSPCPSFAVIYYSSNSTFYVLFRFILSVVLVFLKVKLSKLIKITEKHLPFNDKQLCVKFSHGAIN